MVSTKLLRQTGPIVDTQARLDVLEKYGIYTSLTDLKNAKAGSLPYYLITATGKLDYSYLTGNFTGKSNDLDIVALNNTPLSVGALVRQSSENLSFTGVGVNSVFRNLRDKVRESVSVVDYRYVVDLDDTAAFARAQATNKRVFFPAGQGTGLGGVYLLKEAVLNNNAYVYGEGDNTVIQMSSAQRANVFYANSGSASAYVENITLRDMKLVGRLRETGFSEQAHLIRVSGVRNFSINRVSFTEFAGDGLYVGSGDNLSDERHNIDVRIVNNFFDGYNNENRNAISFTDAVGVVIEGNTFIRCSRPNMPGPIDFEPDDQPFHRISDITVSNNRFDKCGGNLGQISFLNPTSVPLPSRIRISGNKFTNYIGTGSDISIDCRRTIVDTDYSMAVLIDGNQGVGGNRPVDFYSCRGIHLTASNNWQDYREGALIGFSGATDRPMDLEFHGQYRLIGKTTDGLRIYNGTNLTISGKFDNCGRDVASSFAIQFAAGSTSNVTLRDITIVPKTSHTVGINNAGHTFTPTSNRMTNVRMNGLLNQFQYRSETRASLVYANNWTDNGGTLVERNNEGRVSINLNLTGGSTPSGTLVATLPLMFRPTAPVFGVFVSGTAFAFLRFDPDGSIFITPNNAPAAALQGFISFTTGT